MSLDFVGGRKCWVGLFRQGGGVDELRDGVWLVVCEVLCCVIPRLIAMGWECANREPYLPCYRQW